MAIEISNKLEQPSLVYDKVFMQSLEISQRSQMDDNIPAHYTLKVAYTIYAVDGTGQRHFLPRTRHVIIEDYGALAMQKAMQGDMDLAQAMMAIEMALAKILEDQTDLGTATVSVRHG